MRRAAVVLFLLLLSALPASAATATLTWMDNSTTETSFKIQRTTAKNLPACQTATGFTLLATVGADVTTYVDSTLLSGHTYCYRVIANDGVSDSAPSNIAGISVPGPCTTNGSGIVLVKHPC